MQTSNDPRNEPQVEIHPSIEGVSPKTAPAEQKPPGRLKKQGLNLLALTAALGAAVAAAFFWIKGFPTAERPGDPSPLSRLQEEMRLLRAEVESLQKELQTLKQEWKYTAAQLKAPPLSQTPAVAAQGSKPAVHTLTPGKGAASKPVVYKVRKGDTLSSVARKFRVSPEDLRRWNRLPPQKTLPVGQLLTVYTPIP